VTTAGSATYASGGESDPNEARATHQSGFVVAPTINLLVNGSFEEPMVPPGQYLLQAQGSMFNGWTVIGAGNVGSVSGMFSQNGFKPQRRAGSSG
jgi:hypothetical protein